MGGSGPPSLFPLEEYGAGCRIRTNNLRFTSLTMISGARERARNGLNSDSLPPLFGQRAGVPLRCVMGRPYGGNYAQEDHPELYALSIGARRS